MTLTQLKKAKHYLNLYNKTKSKNFCTRYFLNSETDIKISITELEKEVIISFYGSKSLFSLIRNYSKYKREKYDNESTLSEIEKTARSFDEYMHSKSRVKNNTAIYLINKKLNNPFRNYKFNKEFLKTEYKSDLLNYDIFCKNCVKYYMHSGIIELFNSISDFYYDTINYYLNSTDKKIVIIGFSFISVIARIAYLTYFLSHPLFLNRMECYLYSTPNIGNKHFEKFYGKLHTKEKTRRLYIINCDNDCVYNMMSKRFGFHRMKSSLLIKRKSSKNRIYSSNEYYDLIDKIIKRYDKKE